MKHNISLFSAYHGKENRITNYCGLMMKLVYDNSPKLFEELLSFLFPLSNLKVGPSFSQQEKHFNSVPDLTLRQSSFAIYFENKITDWFHDNQLIAHAQGLKKEGTDITILVLLCSEFKHEHELSELKSKLQGNTDTKDIEVYMITYMDFIDCLQKVCFTDNLAYTLEEFIDFLDREHLLTTWASVFDVVNCSTTYGEVEKGFFISPTGDENRSYRHRRARIFGAYKGKSVSLIGTILGVVIVRQGNDSAKDSIILWNNSKIKNSDIKARAVKTVLDIRNIEHQQRDLQVFLLDEIRQTNFLKETAGGMYATKQYFTINPQITVDELSNKIKDRTWGDFLGRIII